MISRTLPTAAIRPADPILRRLTSFAALSDEDEALIHGLESRRQRYRAGDELVAEGSTTHRPRFIVSGWAGSQRILPDGRRQTFGFALPGDGLGACPGLERAAPATVVAVTDVDIVDAVPAMDALRDGGHPRLLKALTAADCANEAMLLDHIVRLGRQTAYERTAHFLLEMHDRLAAVGLAGQQSFPLPLTQEMLADTLGLSIVHVNRTLQRMRKDRLVEWRGGVAAILQRDVLVSLADYRSPEPRLAKLRR